MAVQLAWGVSAERDRHAWLVDTGDLVDSRSRDHPAGAAVVLGPAGSDPTRVADARADLAALIEAGGAVIAGAGVELGNGFVSARLAGATGDRRDAVFAAMRVPGLAAAGRVGERAAILVALFGVAATKPVGAAAERAIADGRWAAVHLASAAADSLGPEQLESILALEVPDGVDPLPTGAPSVLAANLSRVLERHPRPRRSMLLLDLWQQVCEHQATELRRQQLFGRRSGSVRERLRERYTRLHQDLIADVVQHMTGGPVTIASAAAFVPLWPFWKQRLATLYQDAIAATVLLRTVNAVHRLGVSAGLLLVRDQIAAASALVSTADVKRAQRRIPDEIELPARPIVHIRELDMLLRQERPVDAAFERLVCRRLATAADYGIIVAGACEDVMMRELPEEFLPETWDLDDRHTWRAAVGYNDLRPPAGWWQRPLVRDRAMPSLADRSAADGAATELAADLLWYGELADELFRIRGHDAADITHAQYGLYFNPDPAPFEPEPLTPRLDSITAAVAGVAQLLSLGAGTRGRCRNWTELCTALMSSGVVEHALTREFEIPEHILAENGTTIPGTQARIEIARTSRQLMEWSDYMGNCIAGWWYQEAASDGRSVLIALRDPSGVILLNAELRARTADGWRVDEIRGRFNDDPDPGLDKAFRTWVRLLRPTEPNMEPVGEIERPAPSSGRRPVRIRVLTIGPELRRAAREHFVAAEDAVTVLSRLAGHEAAEPKALTALRRAPANRLARICVDALDDHRVTLPRLWAAGGARPLAAAIGALDPASVAGYPRLLSLTKDAPLPSRALRALVKDPDIAAARSMDLVAARLRGAIARLARDGDQVLTRAILRDPSPDVLCPLIVVITCAAAGSLPTVPITEPGADAVPGFPASSLSDPAGPWHRAWSSAAELGATPEQFHTHVTTTGVRAPVAWLSSGGWPSLWNRAAGHTR